MVEYTLVGLLRRNTMEDRVMKLTETKAVMDGRTRVLRGVCGVRRMLFVMGATATFHLRPTFAETAAVQRAGQGVAQM